MQRLASKLTPPSLIQNDNAQSDSCCIHNVHSWLTQSNCPNARKIRNKTIFNLPQVWKLRSTWVSHLTAIFIDHHVGADGAPWNCAWFPFSACVVTEIVSRATSGSMSIICWLWQCRQVHGWDGCSFDLRNLCFPFQSYVWEVQLSFTRLRQTRLSLNDTLYPSG